MLTLDQCPVYDHGKPETVATLDVESRKRFINFSRLKYGGLMDDWVERIPLVVLKCPKCGHFWYRNQPQPKDLAAMYAARQLSVTYTSPSREPTSRMLKEMQGMRRLFESNSSPTLLDYGSGFGRWARAATQAGFTVTAFEPSATRGAEEKTPFELVHDLCAIKGRRFDAVQLEQVLEHIPDPLQTLRMIRDFCHSQTILRVTVPNLLRSQEGRAIWREWPFDGERPHTLAPFEHLHGFTPKSLRLMLEVAGFKTNHIQLIKNGHLLNSIRYLFGSNLMPTLSTTQAIVVPR
jgi:hypothetical protein